MDVRVETADDMRREGAAFAARIRPQENRATLVALSGELGAGKTTFTQGLAEALGVERDVVSPTFVLMRSYPLRNQHFSQLVHIDAYRLEKPEELSALRWNELTSDPGNLILLEWPERASGASQGVHTRIRFTQDDDARILSYGE